VETGTKSYATELEKVRYQYLFLRKTLQAYKLTGVQAVPIGDNPVLPAT
jgi:hypothetical protein